MKANHVEKWLAMKDDTSQSHTFNTYPAAAAAVVDTGLGGGGDLVRGGVFDLLFSLILWLGDTKADGDLGAGGMTPPEGFCNGGNPAAP